MSSKLYRGSDILKQAKQSKTVKLTRTQTAKQAKSAIARKYKELVPSAQYYHRGSGVWIKYSPIVDNKRTSKKVKSKIPKNFESIRHKIDVQGVDTGTATKKPKMMHVDYFVNYGQDTRHLFETKRFDKLYQAKAFITKLNKNQAYQLVRMETPSGISATGSKKKTVAERVI